MRRPFAGGRPRAGGQHRLLLATLGPGLCAAGLLLAAGVPVLLWIGQHTDWDLCLADAMYDMASGSFPARHAWWAEVLLHVWARYLLIALAGAGVAFVAWDALRPWSFVRAAVRLRMRAVAACSIAIPVVVSALKHRSFLHCPWDIDRYGGTAVYVRLLDALPASITPGRCFPAGHATSALWLAALSLLWGRDRPRAALATFAAGLLAGIGMGWMQQMRGAHFLSHTLWSAWIAAALVWACAVWLRRQEAAAAAVAAPLPPQPAGPCESRQTSVPLSA